MAVTYSTAAITARMQGVADTIDVAGNGNMLLRIGTTTLSTIQLANPCGTANGGVLTFSGTLLDPAAVATGLADNVIIQDANGNTVVSGLTVGIPGNTADVLITNGLNSTLITAGQTVQCLSAQITGS